VATTTTRKVAKAAPKKAAPAVTDVVELDELADAIAALRKVRSQIEKLDKVKSKHERAIKEALGDATSGTVAGEKVVTWARTERKTVSVELLREKYPEVADNCVKIVQVRTFQLVKPE
jgi:predicted phage-related endonuclease